MRTIKFIEAYLQGLGFEAGDYVLKENEDSEFGSLISLTIKENHPKIGSLLGKHRKNLKALEQLIIVVGRNEGKTPYFVCKFLKE